MLGEVRGRPQASSSDGQRQEWLSHPEDTGEQETVDLYGAATDNSGRCERPCFGISDRSGGVGRAHQIRGAHQTRKGQAIWVFASARCIILLSFATSGVASQQPPSHCQRRAIALTRHLAGRTPPLFRVLGVWSVVSTARPSPRLWTARAVGTTGGGPARACEGPDDAGGPSATPLTWGFGSSDWTRTSNLASQDRGRRSTWVSCRYLPYAATTALLILPTSQVVWRCLPWIRGSKAGR